MGIANVVMQRLCGSSWHFKYFMYGRDLGIVVNNVCFIRVRHDTLFRNTLQM
jgi:hypothetical protein